MKRVIFGLILTLVLMPGGVKAQTSSCVDKGYTVIFVNGIFGDLQKAQQDAENLQHKIGFSYDLEPITVQVGYNPTHLAGVADLAQSTVQMFDSTISNYDRDTILLQIYPEVTTRKLILVGHSQGAFYTNEMYFYLLNHGEPIESVSVYNVGSPASYTAGANKGSKYLNSSGDKLLEFLRAANFNILPNNVDIDVDTSSLGWQGHGFSDTYLAGASERMIEDLHTQMQALKPTYSSNKEYCFTPPDRSAGYLTQSVVLAVADPTANVIKVGATITVKGAVALLNGAATLAKGTIDFITDTIIVTTTPHDTKKDDEKTFEITKKLYGSSLNKEDFKELLGTQGSAVVLAAPKPKPIAINGGFVEGTSTGPVETPTTITPFIQAPSSPTQTVFNNTEESTPTQEAEDISDEDTPSIPDPEPSLPPPPVPPAIVINEVQWAGDKVSSEREWIELNNLSAQDVDMSNLAIVATEGGTQYIHLSGTISPNGYFIIQRQTNAPLNPSANPGLNFDSTLKIEPFGSLSDSGEQLALVQIGDWGTTTVDITPPISACGGWCGGSTLASSGVINATLSMERIDAHSSGETASNWASNDTYTVSANMPGGDGQPLYATVLAENSKHIIQDAGWYCLPDTMPISSGQEYAPPPGSVCTYLSRFVSYGTTVMAQLYKGTLSASVRVGGQRAWVGTNAQFSGDGIDSNEAQPGDNYFIAIWAVRNVPNTADAYTFPYFFETGELWARDGWGGPLVDTGTQGSPTEDYKIIPFTYGP